MAGRKPQTLDHPESLRAAIYVRVSTIEQAAEGHGLDSQRSRCKAMIEAKGWQFLREYADEGVSGIKSRDRRSGLDSLLSDARRGELDVVVTLALDRPIDSGTRPDFAKGAYEALQAYAPGVPPLTTVLLLTHTGIMSAVIRTFAA